jgi:hypothetical protein
MQLLKKATGYLPTAPESNKIHLLQKAGEKA